MSLITITGYKNIMGLSLDDTSLDAQITALIPIAEDEIQRYLGMDLSPSTTYTETYDGTGNTFLRLRQHPITSVTSVVIDTVTQTATFLIDNNKNFIYFSAGGGSFNYGQQNITVTYVAGQATAAVPQTIKGVIAKMVQRNIALAAATNNANGAAFEAETIGDYAYKNGFQGINSTLNDDIRKTLDLFRPIKYIF